MCIFLIKADFIWSLGCVSINPRGKYIDKEDKHRISLNHYRPVQSQPYSTYYLRKIIYI